MSPRRSSKAQEATLRAVIEAGGGTVVPMPTKRELVAHAAATAVLPVSAAGAPADVAALGGSSMRSSSGRHRPSSLLGGPAAATVSVPGLIVIAQHAAQVEGAGKEAALVTSAGLPIFAHASAVSLASLCQSLTAALARPDAVLKEAATSKR